MAEGTQEFSDGIAARIGAATYDPTLWIGERAGMRERRRRLISRASGRVLEIGAGTGLNAELYPEGLEEIVLTEPDPAMARRLAQRVAGARRPAHVVEAPAEALPFEDRSFDTVVSTLVLCTAGNPDAALAEIARVLKPQGRLLFCEHVRSDSARLARWQDRLAPAWSAFAAGCRCNQDTRGKIERHLRIDRLEAARWRFMPPLVHPLVVGEATPA